MIICRTCCCCFRFTAAEAAAVDLDGRCVITDHGLFILINVYLPAATGGDKTAHGRDKVTAVSISMALTILVTVRVVVTVTMTVAICC